MDGSPFDGPDGRQRTVIALAAVARFAAAILMGTGLAVIVERLGGSPFAVSMVLGAYFGGMMLFAPFWGAVADATGRRRDVLLWTSALATLTVPLLVVAEGVWAPIGLRGLYAVFAAGFSPVMLSFASARGGDDDRGSEMGFFNSARGAGITVGQVGAGVLLGLATPDTFYLVVAGVSAVSVLAVALVTDPADVDGTTDPKTVVSEVRRRLFPPPDEREHFDRGGLRWLYVALVARNTTVLGVISLLPTYFAGPVGASTAVMGLLLALNPAGQTVCMYVFGKAADAYGRKPLITAGIAGSGAFAVLAAAASLPTAEGVRVVVAGLAMVLIAASFSAMNTGAVAFIGDVAPPEHESGLMGLRTTAKGLGGLLGPVLVGSLATATSYRTAFLLGSSLAFGAAVLASVRLVETNPAAGGTAFAADD
ncbi:MFS transporter [Halospeciosus flavus]|uniref:MFS transporter n=1 Tax=Halospeciosus flavus TaxID=3032283 RepID=A0ABD5Z910_9EURY|nr:MFS transporter [Halospeciosus flavus]